jgi:serine/threonine-protein kinase HipA
MRCLGCYKEVKEGYCLDCRKLLFNGEKVSHYLPFDPPNDENIAFFQSFSKRFSISGVQLKYALKLEKKNLVLTDSNGQYILKPIPTAKQFAYLEAIPENEHLTMQIARQIFKIPVAANALIHFKDGTPAYVTKRFDVQPNGGKFLQEDFAQLSGKTSSTHGENFKYDGSYADIAKLIQQFVPASILATEQFYTLVVFNYIFSNGDAHLKNFSLIRNENGEYQLSPAYDLLCSVIHSPGESDTALQLFEKDHEAVFFSKHGYYGRMDFLELAKQIDIMPNRAEKILQRFENKKDKVINLIDQSFLSDHIKTIYLNNFQEKLRRLVS